MDFSSDDDIIHFVPDKTEIYDTDNCQAEYLFAGSATSVILL
jgi:hypothetical protein